MTETAMVLTIIVFIWLWAISKEFIGALIFSAVFNYLLKQLLEYLGDLNWPIIIFAVVAILLGTSILFSLKSGKDEELSGNEKIKAIKEVRATTGLGLKESKKLVETTEFQRDRKKQKAQLEVQAFKMYRSGPVAIDGANLWGCVYSDTDEDHQKAFNAVANLLVRLKASGYDPHVFWDSKFYGFAKVLRLEGVSEGLPNMLSQLLSIEKQKITVSQVGLAADADIIAWATLKKTAIISNDNYNKEIEDYIILGRVSELKDRGLLQKFSYSDGDILVPGLTNLV